VGPAGGPQRGRPRDARAPAAEFAHRFGGSSVAISADAAWLLTGSSRHARLWDRRAVLDAAAHGAAAAAVAELPHNLQVRSVAISADADASWL
jgi:hypothetical protein